MLRHCSFPVHHLLRETHAERTSDEVSVQRTSYRGDSLGTITDRDVVINDQVIALSVCNEHGRHASVLMSSLCCRPARFSERDSSAEWTSNAEHSLTASLVAAEYRCRLCS